MLVWLLGAIAVLEVGLWYLVGRLKPGFQWLITREDVAPQIGDELVHKYVEGSFDPELGWVRQPGSRGEDKTENGVITFHIDEKGRRRAPHTDGSPCKIAVFGDSFAFCRLVADGETWPAQLGAMLGESVENYGVGNYGLDQGILRMARVLETERREVAVMCVVPETMARIHSYWKHYFEYGNVLAFKPRFVLEDGRLSLIPSAVSDAQDFRSYRDRLDWIHSCDGFYKTKFRKDLIQIPYLLCFASRWRRHIPIVWHLTAGRLIAGAEQGWRRAFDVVIRCNACEMARLYRDDAARGLLLGLVDLFREKAQALGAEPVFVVIPQPVDLYRRNMGRDDYSDIMELIARRVQLLDMTEAFENETHRERLYVNGPLGPHVSAYGNRLVAEAVAGVVKPLLSARPAVRQNSARGVIQVNSRQ